LDKFNSIFELLAAFNAAFIISHSFTESLNSRINGVLDNSRLLLNQLEGILNESQTQITSRLKGAATNEIQYLSSIAKDNNNLNKEFEILKNDINLKISNSGISKTFNYYCLFAFIYAISMLLVAGLDVDLKSRAGEIFFIFNVTSILVIASLVKRSGDFRLKSFFSTGYLAFLSSIPTAFLLCFLYHHFRKEGKSCPFNFNDVNLLLALVIPSFHFFFYFLKSMLNRKRLFPKINKDVEKLRNQCEESAKRIANSIEALNAVQKESDEEE